MKFLLYFVQGTKEVVLISFSGYMAPEYAMQGLFSVKSDVFSFGVLVLEIMYGRKNSGLYMSEHGQTLLLYVSLALSLIIKLFNKSK